MYKHNASSIKESSDKMFVSQSEKDKWNSKAEGVHTHDSEYYTKTEMDNMLITSNTTVTDSFINANTCNGFTIGTEILGRSVQYSEDIVITPTYEAGAIYLETGIEGDIHDEDGNVMERWRIQEYIPVQIGDIITMEGDSKANFIIFNKDKSRISHVAYNNTATVTESLAAYVRLYGDVHTKDKKCTIKRTHLPDIRSVGEKREDDGFEFDIVACGENILNCDVVKAVWSYETGVFIPSSESTPYSNIACASKIKVSKGYYLFDIYGDIDYWVLMYDEFGNYTGKFSFISNRTNQCIYNMEKDGYITFYGVVGSTVPVDVYSHKHAIYKVSDNIFTSVPAYKEYKEHFRKTIILPTQLESVQGVSDRLFVREDGIVCIEKKIKTITNIAESVSDIRIPLSQNVVREKTHIFYVTSNKIEHSPVLCDNLPYLSNWSNDTESVFKPVNADGSLHDSLHVRVSKDRFGTEPTAEDFRNFINAFNFKYITKNPEIIEVGHINDIGIPLLQGVNNITTTAKVHNSIKCDIPTSVAGSIESQVEKIADIQNKIDNINNIAHANRQLSTFMETPIKKIENTTDGFVSDIKIEGETVFNHLASNFQNAITFECFNEIEEGSHHDVAKRLGGFKTLKPNTTYTVICNVVENTLDTVNRQQRFTIADSYEYGFISTKQIYIPNGFTGIFKHTFKTPNCSYEELDTLKFKMYLRTYDTCVNRGKITLSECMILEGDWTHKHIKGYVGTVASSAPKAEVKLSTYGKNLFKYDIYNRSHNARYDISNNSIRVYTTPEGGSYTYQYVTAKVKPNTKYTLTFDEPVVKKGKWCIALLPVHDGEPYGKIMNTIERTTKINFTTPSYIGEYGIELGICLYCTHNGNENGMLMGDVTYSNISIVEAEDYGKPIRDNEYSACNIPLNAPLRSLPNGVRDTIEKIDGEYCVVRRCAKVLLDTTNFNLWTMNQDYANETTVLFTIRGSANIWKGKEFIDNAKSDTAYTDKARFILSAYRPTNHHECVGFGTNLDYRVYKSSLETPDLEGFRKYLESKSLSIIYERKVPYIEKLGRDIDIRTFDDVTTVVVDSGYITTNATVTVPNNISNNVKSLSDKIYTMEVSRTNTIKTLLESTFKADVTSYKFQVMTTGARSTISCVDNDLYEMYKYVLMNEEYDRNKMEEKIDFYTLISVFSMSMADELLSIIAQNNIEIEETN